MRISTSSKHIARGREGEKHGSNLFQSITLDLVSNIAGYLALLPGELPSFCGAAPSMLAAFQQQRPQPRIEEPELHLPETIHQEVPRLRLSSFLEYGDCASVLVLVEKKKIDGVCMREMTVY
jgi:hypothetical protein